MEESLEFVKADMLKAAAGGIQAQDIRTYSGQTLAYIGDAVYELYVRSMIVMQGDAPANRLHKRASQLVKAQTQAWMIRQLEPLLEDEELHAFKRGRNAKTYTSAKNATMTDYRMATGFEALVGYLYLKNDYERMSYLIRYGIQKFLEEKQS